MPYWENVTRSFAIAWRHKYLWLLALFAGEGGGGGSFNYSQGTRQTGTRNPNFPGEQLTAWLSQHAGLLIVVGVIWLIILIAFFILAAVCEGALIRGAAEHDADRPFGLREAWRNGVHTMWVIVRFRLLLVALGLPAILIVGGVIVGGVAAAFSHQTSLAVVLILLGVLLALFLIVYLIYLGLLDRFGARTAVLEQTGAVASLQRAHRLLFRRLGRSLLVWLLSVAVGIVVAIVAGIVLLVAALPLIIGIFVVANGGSAGWAVIVFGVIVALVVALPITGFLNAQASTYWTLSFRRMEIDTPPAYAYPPQPAPQP